jgi:hypothetical protein
MASTGGWRLPDDLTDIDARTIQQQLNRALTMHPELNGIRLASAAGNTWSSGNYPQDIIVTETTWLEEQLLLTHPVARDGKVIGVLAGLRVAVSATSGLVEEHLPF